MTQRFLSALSRLPLPMLHGLSTLLFFAAYHLLRWKRGLATTNLQRAFPDKPAQEVEALARAHFRGLFDTTLETIKGRTLPAAELARRVSIQNLDLLEALAEKPFLLVSAHQGNWEWQTLALSHRLGVPVEAIYAPGPSPALDRFLADVRTRFGITLLRPDTTMVEIARRAKVPRALVLLADQNPRRDAERCWPRFLEQDTAFGVGLARIARLTRYPIVFQHGRRLSRGHYEIRFELLAEAPYPREPGELMARYAALLEASIHANPPDWLWSYERWRYAKPLYA